MTSISDSLKYINKQNNSIYSQYSEIDETNKWFNKIEEEINSKYNNKSDIPAFFLKKETKQNNSLDRLLSRCSRTAFLQKKYNILFDPSELDHVYKKLINFSEEGCSRGQERIGYSGLRKAVSEFSQNRKNFFFSPAVFAKFPRDERGHISVNELFNFVVRKALMLQVRIGLSSFESDGDDCMTNMDLDAYFQSLTDTVPCLKGQIEEGFMQFYLCIAVRKVMFLLDPMNVGKVKIRDICNSSIMTELVQLNQFSTSSPESETTKNWFHPSGAMQLYEAYLDLDMDMDGMLSKAEMRYFSGGSLNSMFIDRLFEETITYDEKMDFKGFVDFIVALENRQSTAAIRYFWPILDVNKRGYINSFDIHYFFREISKRLESGGAEKIASEDIVEEIFAMIKPESPMKIGLADLLRCQVGGTVISMLIDVNEFWAYESREDMIAEEVEEQTRQEHEEHGLTI